MNDADRHSSIFWLVIGVAAAVRSLSYGFGTVSEPGPGFITFFAGMILAFLSLLLFLSTFRKSGDKIELASMWKGGIDVKKAVYVMALLVVYTAALKPVGFLITTFFLLFLLFMVKGKYRLRTVVLMSLLITIGNYLLFDVWLQAQLPKGILERIL